MPDYKLIFTVRVFFGWSTLFASWHAAQSLVRLYIIATFGRSQRLAFLRGTIQDTLLLGEPIGNLKTKLCLKLNHVLLWLFTIFLPVSCIFSCSPQQNDRNFLLAENRNGRIECLEMYAWYSAYARYHDRYWDHLNINRSFTFDEFGKNAWNLF